MRQKVELIGGYFDGMETFVEPGQQEVILIAPAHEKPSFDINDTPEAKVKTIEVKYRRRLGHPRKFDWVKP